MDDYTLQQQLESLAGNATTASSEKDLKPEPMSTTITRWQTLFDFSEDEAIDRIVSHRNDLTRTRISDAHWEDLLRAEKEPQGYDREAYEYELELQKKKAVLPTNEDDSPASSTLTYLVELTGQLDSAEKVQQAAGSLEKPPPVVTGTSVEDGRSVSLCCIDAKAKAAILRWASHEGGGFEPTIIVDPRSLR